jgi:hypothetical protein
MKRQINILFHEENSGFPRFEIPENVTCMSLLFHCHVIGDSPIVNHFGIHPSFTLQYML